MSLDFKTRNELVSHVQDEISSLRRLETALTAEAQFDDEALSTPLNEVRSARKLLHQAEIYLLQRPLVSATKRRTRKDATH